MSVGATLIQTKIHNSKDPRLWWKKRFITVLFVFSKEKFGDSTKTEKNITTVKVKHGDGSILPRVTHGLLVASLSNVFI